MRGTDYGAIVSFIWSVADDCLRDIYVRGKYRDVILPMTVIRRLDAVLEPTKQKVIETRDMLDANDVERNDGYWQALSSAAGQSFCNISNFTLKDLTTSMNMQSLKENFIAYLDGFSPNVQDILKKFDFKNQIKTMVNAGILDSVIEKFINPKINLSPYPVLDDSGNVKLPALDNHAMGTVFEELIRRFNEENNEEAGEHFTPRDVVELMADLIVMPVMDQIKDGTYTIYDGAAGTLGMCTVAEERLQKIAERQGKTISVHLYGQEVNSETYAISKADMLIKGNGEDSDNIFFGSTLSQDAFEGRTFDLMLSNPPYGKSWRNDKKNMGGDNMIDSRFIKNYDGEPDYNMVPRLSDGQLLFLLNNIAKMNRDGLSRIAEVHNGSALFTGDAGSGESNARRYMIEKDLVECIIALPENIFYNTGIGTFIWILSNKKEERRKGKIQLIDATEIKTGRKKNLGNKNCDLSPENQEEILALYRDFKESEHSKIFDNKDFGYWKVSVQRPLRKKVVVTKETLSAIREKVDQVSALGKISKKNLGEMGLKTTQGAVNAFKNDEVSTAVVILEAFLQDEPYMDYMMFEKAFNKKVKEAGVGTNVIKCFEKTGLDALFIKTDENAEIIKDRKGNPQADIALNDTENIPLNYEGGIEAYMEKEVLPFTPDAFIDYSATKIGYEISFTKHFYKPKNLEKVEDIIADLRKITLEADNLFHEIMEGLE